MFDYLSFLRPPPAQATLGQPVIFVPQIANDLRTELCAVEHDICYAWEHDGHCGSFAKLTTWSLGTAYKPLGVALPAKAKPGESWRICLVVGLAPALDLSDPMFGQHPFPVTSMPITVVGVEAGLKSGKKFAKQTADTNKSALNPSSSKQEKIERFYLLPPGNTRIMRLTEQTSFDLDKKIWDSGVALSAWFARLVHADMPASKSGLVGCLRNKLLTKSVLQIIELGAGTGLVSLALTGLLSTRTAHATSPFRARVLATDLPSAIELIDHNRAANDHLLHGSTGITVNSIALDWDKPIPEEIWDGAFDIIIMADVTYNTASFSALLDTVTGLLTGPSPGCPAPMIVLAYKCRDPAERTLWIDAAARGISFTQIDSVRGRQEPGVEIWVGGWEQDIRSSWNR